MFDGVHLGHRHLLNVLKKHATAHGLRPLAVTFSNHPLDIIAPAQTPSLLCSPTEKERLLMATGVEVAMLRFDDALRNTSSADFMHMLRSRYGVAEMLLGFNNRFGHDSPRDFESYRRIADSQGVRITLADEFLSGANTVSSSEIRKFLHEGNVTAAARLLGRKYAITGTVVHGKQLGRAIGFPTANLSPTYSRQLIPAIGVYAAVASLPNGETHPAVVNIGHRPTVDATDAPLSIEAHIINYNENLYRQTVTLQFIHCLRAEQRFPSLDALREAIATDCTATLRLLQN